VLCDGTAKVDVAAKRNWDVWCGEDERIWLGTIYLYLHDQARNRTELPPWASTSDPAAGSKEVAGVPNLTIV
jgi:hypothetical protein